MTSPKQIASNKQNALVSTGPKTVAGKRLSARNALTHGLRSTAPIVPGESPAAWSKHRNGIVQSLAPDSPLESELAERAALLLWRLRRVTTHECLTTGGAVAETLDDMQGKEADFARERKAVLERRERLAFWETALVKMDELSSLADDGMIPQDVAGVIVEFVLNGAMDWTGSWQGESSGEPFKKFGCLVECDKSKRKAGVYRKTHAKGHRLRNCPHRLTWPWDRDKLKKGRECLLRREK